MLVSRVLAQLREHGPPDGARRRGDLRHQRREGRRRLVRDDFPVARRATAGVRAVVNEHVVVKAEYLHNGEYGGIPQIPNDVFTSSLLLTY